MWNRSSGKSDDSKDNLPSRSSWRNDDEQRHPTHRTSSIASAISNSKSSPSADDRDRRGFNPTSTTYSSTTREQHPGAALASTASSYGTVSGNTYGEPYMAPDLVKNVSLADQMPKSNTSRSSREQDQAREIKDKRRSKTDRSDRCDQGIEKRRKRDQRDNKDKSLKRSEKGLDEELGTSRGPDDFPDQVTSSGFSQFPGQYDGPTPGPNSATHEHSAMSSHVQDQFPGQFPIQSSAPYRPPLAASEGGPGLAAEYYGDAGQSVAEQPGNRANTPSLIIGAEPHLQPALAVAAPPPEPSASGAIGAAASFFSGQFEGNEATLTYLQQPSSTHVAGQIRPNSNHHSSSAPIISTIGGTVIGSATGYLFDGQTSSHQQPPAHESSIGGAPSEYSSIATHRPPSETHYPSTNLPSEPGKQSSQSFSNPTYAAGIASAAGLAGATYEHNHHSSNQNFSSTSQYSMTSMARRHRNHGPLSALVDFFKDPDGVAQFEEYSQIVGVCRHCFAPGSSPRDAPRKHHYRRRRSNERYGSSTRVDKDNRYYSSENEGRRKNKSWLGTGLAGYGLAKFGESLFKDEDDFDDTHSVETGRFSPDARDRRARRRSRSREQAELGISGDGKSDRKGTHDTISNGTEAMRHSTRHHSITRSRSKDRKNGLTEAAISTAVGASVVTSSPRRQSRSPRGISVKSRHMSHPPSPERRRKSKKNKKDRGFFLFGNGSSSSSSMDLVHTASQNKDRRSRRPTSKSKDDQKAEEALLGLGAAAAALALNDGRQSQRKKGVRGLIGVKETKDYGRHGSAQVHRSQKPPGNLDEELWESAPEDDDESMNSGLAYGAPVRRDSRTSFSSESSGTNKWGWRWGSKKNRRTSSPRRKSPEHSNLPPVASMAGADPTHAALSSLDERHGSAMTSTTSLPLQHVYPVPTSDPSRFDVGPVAPIASPNRPSMSSRPEAIPLQHPRPIAPVSTIIYASQTAYDHSSSAPTGAATLSQTHLHRYPEAFDAGPNIHEASIPGSFSHFKQERNNTLRNFGVRRRDSSPARYGAEPMSSSVAPRRRTSTRDDPSAVRFDLTEEQEESDRRERRRKRKEDSERREAGEQEQAEKDHRALKEESIEKRGSKTKAENHSEVSTKSWVGPVAAGIIGATTGSAAVTEKSRSEETREERRERRRREREREDEEDALNKIDRRRRQRERDEQEAALKKHGRFPDTDSPPSKYVDHRGHPLRKEDMSVWQEAASAKRSSSHENYGAFFTPLELLNKSSDQVKITSANADADIDLEQVPQIVTVEPQRIHDLSGSPPFLFADADDKSDSSKPSFPWQVPRLRLVEPTPPSTRGSTPILEPKDAGDEGFEESRKDPSPSKVKWADEQNREYTVIAPKEDRDEFIEPPSEEVSGIDPLDLSINTHEQDLPNDKPHSHNDSTTEGSSASYGEDVEFAAILAVSAEDADFDPSIVINNPTYRRRDSPPGSNERSMPGKFDDEDEPWLERNERKRAVTISRHQGQNDGPNGRDETAIVKDIVSQVEDSEFKSPGQDSSEDFDDDWESIKRTEHTNSEKKPKTSGSGNKGLETSETGSETPNSENRDMYESHTEDVPSIASISTEAKSGRKSHKNAKQDSTGYDDTTSTVSSPSTNEASKDPKSKSKDNHRGSIWDRVLGRSSHSLPQENSAKDVTEEAAIEGFKEPEKKDKMSKERSSSRDNYDDHNSKEQDSIEDTTPQVPDTITQDKSVEGQRTSLPLAFSDAGSVAKYLDHGIEPKQVEERQTKSFLVMRPEPPPPPDTRARNNEFSNPLETTSLPTSPRAESEIKSRRFSDAGVSSPAQTTAVLPSSPTAVPFHFRRPGRSSSFARSLSQTSLPSNNSAADIIPKQKTRPRSMESKSSQEIRPLSFVERHRSLQEPTLDEIYPSLPSSHTTSRSSSTHNPEERDHLQEGDSQLNEKEHEPIEAELVPMTSPEKYSIQSDLLGSQRATPTASSLHESRTVQDLPSPQASKDSPLSASVEENPQQSSSTLKSGVLGAILGGSAGVALNEATQNYDSMKRILAQEENEDPECSLDATSLDTVTHPSYNDALTQEEDISPQKPKKAKKNKRKTGQPRQETIQTSFAGAAEAQASTKAVDPEPLNPEAIRQIQEQDAQDAVDSWFPLVRPSTKVKKGKKGKGRALIEKLLEENEPSSSLYEPPKGNFETKVSAEGQENDSLTRAMSHEQVVDIMAAVAQETHKNENEASQSAAIVKGEPLGIKAEEDRSELKGKNDNNSQMDLLQDDLQPDDVSENDLHTNTLPEGELPQKNLPQGDLPQNNHQYVDVPPFEVQQEIHPKSNFLQVHAPLDEFSHSQEPQGLTLERDSQPDSLPVLSSSSALATGTSTDLTLEQYHANLSKSPKAKSASQEMDRGDPITAISSQFELSPKGRPSPDGDDHHHLVDEPVRTLTSKSLDQNDDKEKKAAAESPVNVPDIQDPSTVMPRPQGQLRDLPSQAEQADAGKVLAAPSAKDSRKSKEARQSFSVEGHETVEIRGEDGLLPSVFTSTTLEDNRLKDLKDLNDEPAIEVSQEKSEPVEDNSESFMNERGGEMEKKAVQNFSAEDRKTTKVEEVQGLLPHMTTSEVPEDREAIRSIDEAAADFSRLKAEPLKDEWTGFNDQDKGEQGTKVRPDFTVGNNRTKEIEQKNESLSELADPKTPRDGQPLDLVGEPALHVPDCELVEEKPIDLSAEPTNKASKPQVLVDEWAGPNSSKTDKRIEIQNFKTSRLAPGPDQIEYQFEQQPDARDDANDRASFLATTRTSQEVSAMLGFSETEASVGGESKETFPNVSQEEHDLQKPLESHSSDAGRNLPRVFEPTIPQSEDAPREVHYDEKAPTLDVLVAGTNAAQLVQDILAREDNAESATDAKSEAVAVPTGMEETNIETPMKEITQDWDALKKKKKGKKGKKSEAFSWDEPETTEQVEVSSPPSTMNTVLGHEPAAIKPIEEDGLDRDRSKKKKKGKKGKNSEAFSWDEPKTIEQVEVSSSPSTMRNVLGPEPAAAADKPIQEDGRDRDASNKKKKGKKGKRNEVISLDEPEVIESREFSGPPAPTEPPPLEQEPAGKANDELISQEPKKDKKNKKGKKKGVSRAMDDEIRDEDEPNVVPTEAPQESNKAEEVAALSNDIPEGTESSVIFTEVPRSDQKPEGLRTITRNSPNPVEPSVVPTGVQHSDYLVEDGSAVDQTSVTSNVRGGFEPDLGPAQDAQDKAHVKDLPAGGTPPMLTEFDAPVENLQLAVPTVIAQDDRNEKSLDVPLKQEQDLMPAKGKKEKKSKKSKKFNDFSLDDETPTLSDAQTAGTKNLEKDELEQTIPASVDVVEESGKTIPKIRLEQKEDLMPPAKKKDRKRSKKSSAFSQDGGVLPTLENGSKPEYLEEEVHKQSDPSSVGMMYKAGSEVEGHPEETKDREETRKTLPLERRGDEVTAPSEPETTQGLDKDFETDSNINILDVSGELGTLEGKREEAVHGDSDSTPADAATAGIAQKTTSSLKSSLEQPAGASEEASASHANELESTIVPAVETHVDSLYGFKPSKKDKKRAKKAQPLTWEDEEVFQEPRAVNKSGITEETGNPSIVPNSQHNESWSNIEAVAQQIEPTEIVQPSMKPEEDRAHQASLIEGVPSQPRHLDQTAAEADQEDTLTSAEKGKEGESANSEMPSITEREEDRSHEDIKEPAWVTADNLMRENEQTVEEQPRDHMDTPGAIRSDQEQLAVGLGKEQAPLLTDSGLIDGTRTENLPSGVPLQVAEKNKGQHDEAQPDEPKLGDLASTAAPGPVQETVETVRSTDPVTDVQPLGKLDKDEPIPAVEFEMLDAQEQGDYNKEYAQQLDRVIPNIEPVVDLGSPEGSHVDKPVPAVEVEMLDAQEQRDYNEEYTKELERQLSPLLGGDRAGSSLDEAESLMFSPPSINSVIERPYEEEHRPLARPPDLEDIIEESSSRSGSVQGTLDREDENIPLKATKKGKKHKKSTKQQPIIWEDETATPPLELRSDQGAKPFIISSEGSDSLTIDAARPLDLEESVNHQPLEDRTIASPTGDFNNTYNKSEVKNDWSGDYFAIQPSKSAEEDVGREDTQEFRRALAAEQLYTSKDRSPARELKADQDDYARDDGVKPSSQDEEPSLVTECHIYSKRDAQPSEDNVKDDFDPVPLKGDKTSTKAEKAAPAREAKPHTLGQEDVINQTRDLETSTADTLYKTSPSQQHSLTHKDERSSLAEGRSSSRDNSGTIEGVAAAVGLGVGALAAESLSSSDSKKQRGHGENDKKAGRWADFEADTEGPKNAFDSLDRKELAVGEQEHRQTPESKSLIGAWQHHQAPPLRSPPLATHEPVADHPVVENLGQSSETPEYRDSAIYVSGSPMISEETPYHRAVRDSGYPDTEASPTIENELEILDAPTKSERDIAAGERVGHVQRRHSQAHEIDEPLRSTSRNPFEISVETNSDYDVSVSRPRERQNHSRRKSGVTYDSDDSADSGFDVQRRRRRQAMAAEPREPSPVSSTTKDRSSALFGFSPSAREEIAKPQHQDASLHYDHMDEKPTWSFEREGSPKQRSREASREGVSDNIPAVAPGPTGSSISTGQHEATETSLFGGSQSYDDDLLSPTRSPPSSESRGRRRLNTISEDSADANGSPLPKKDQRALSDVGSPESGVKGRRMRSPPVGDDVDEDSVSIHDPMSRQPWPAGDEEQSAVDERSRSGNSDQLSALSSRHSRSRQPGMRFGQREEEYRSASAGSMQSEKSIHAIIRTPDQVRSASGLSYRSSATPTPPLRRVDRSASGDLRGASRKDEAKSHAKSSSELEAERDIGIPSSSTYDPVTDKGKSRADMADVYEGWGDVRGQSPMSPTRPPSMRKRQSMQLLDLETRLDQIVSENRLLASQKLTAENALQEQARDHSQQRHAYEEAMQEHKMYLTRKGSELNELKKTIEQLHEQAAHRTEVNEELTSSRRGAEEHEQRYSQLRAEHARTHEQWQQSTRELENLKESHSQLSTGMEDIVRHEVTVALEEKNIELRQLQSELENAKQQVRNLQQQLLASRSSDDFIERDEDYFDSRCQSLCQHVQQWVLRFSKFSDMKACYLAREIQDEKVVDRMENAILDGSDVDDYLSDRVKRRDVFMSVVMTMIWKFIFTRYLFGMDREQRQKLKNLEKTLQEVGPISAVHKWRATTLTLLMKREVFENQRATDTEAVVHEIYDILATFLPPPSHLVAQIQDSLRKVIDAAVDLSIEMRTQRAEYSMLPPLQPEYDTNGDLVRKVYFSALTMNERSGATSSNEALQEQHAVVRMVLFPLVVKNEDDDEQIVVCPAQVLTAEGSKGKKTVRVLSAQGGRSEASFAGSDVRMEGGII